MPAEWRNAKIHKSKIFALMTDEKSSARISHRHVAIKSLMNGEV